MVSSRNDGMTVKVIFLKRWNNYSYRKVSGKWAVAVIQAQNSVIDVLH